MSGLKMGRGELGGPHEETRGGIGDPQQEEASKRKKLSGEKAKAGITKPPP